MLKKGEACFCCSVQYTPAKTPSAEYTAVDKASDPSFAFCFNHMTTFTKTSLTN